MRRLIAAAVLLCAGLLVPATALGHADLVSATPADGTTVGGPRVEIVLVFSQSLANGSRGDVIGAAGTVTFLALDSTDPTRMRPNQEVDYAPGDYTIEWTSVAEDGDILRGVLGFTVTAPTPTPTPTPTLEPSATPVPATPALTAEPSASPAPTAPPGDGSGDGSAVIFPIVIGLLLVGLAAWWLIRRRSSAL